MNDYTQPSAFKHVDTVSLNAESLKFVKEMSDGPYTYGSNSGHIDRYEVFDPLGYNATGEFHDEEKARRLCESFNEVWHSRDQELASKDARIKELESQIETLKATIDATKDVKP
jgi:hypothetical protein